MPRKRTMRDHVGQRFGRYVVIREVERINPDLRRVLCRCDCGTEKAVSLCGLTRGTTRSCGCLNREICRDRFRKHGRCGTPEYHAWQSMIARCTRETHPEYYRYGGRGISVCREWLTSFDAFFKDMGLRPSPGHSIDRFPDMNGNYEPGNCRWATQLDQMQNMRRNHYVTHDGITLTVSEWARRFGIERRVLGERLKRGWSFEKAVSEPISQLRTKKKKNDAVHTNDDSQCKRPVI